MSPFLQAQSHQHTLSLFCMTHLPGQSHAAPGLFASSLALSPCRAWSCWDVSLYSTQRGMQILAGGGSPQSSVQHCCCRTGHLQLAASGGTKAAVWPRVTFGSDASFSLLHPSALPTPLSELCPCRESHLRTDPSETEGAAAQQDFFSVCVFANQTGFMTWFTNLLAQQRRKNRCSPGANHPDPAEGGEGTSTGTGTIT